MARIGGRIETYDTSILLASIHACSSVRLLELLTQSRYPRTAEY